MRQKIRQVFTSKRRIIPILRELTMDEIGFVAGGRMQDRSPMPKPMGPDVTSDVGGGGGIPVWNGGGVSVGVGPVGGFPPNGGVVTVTVGGSSGGSSGGSTDWAAEAARLRDVNERNSGSPND